MRGARAALCVGLFLSFSSHAAVAQPAAPASHEAALLATMKLWGDIRLFDPAVARDASDWDAAFAAAEPPIIDAGNADTYRAAVVSLLAPLHDPATHAEGADIPGAGRISSASVRSATVITIPHDVTDDETAVATDAARTVDAAAGSPIVLFDVRGVSQGTAGGAVTLDYFFSSESPIAELIDGSVTLPRERSRSYLGFPSQNGGFQGYSAQDSIADGDTIRGRSKVRRRLGFVVDAGTSLPPMALALAAAGDAAIYTTGGNPSILAPSVAEMRLPYNVRVAFRTSDLPDFTGPLAFQRVRDPQDAVAKLASSSSPQASPLPSPSTIHAAIIPNTGSAFPAEPTRMLAVAQIYNVIRYFSPYTKLMHDDWDSAALRAIADERSAHDSRAYLLGLMRFYAHLHDSHGFVTGNMVGTEFGAGVPFAARYLHRNVVVTQVAPNAPGSPVRVGDVIDAVDGVPIRAAMDDIERYICSSTPQAADYAALRPSSEPSVFSGRRGTNLSVTFHRAGGKLQTATFVRNFFTVRLDRSGAKYFVLPGNVGYVDFDRLDPSEVNAMFRALRNTRAIVFDNRGYPRGAAWEIAPRLTQANNVRAALFDTPLVTQPLDAVQGEIQPLPTYQQFYQLLPATTGSRYLHPTVMLIDERAISQSEHSALFFRQAAHTTFVGTPTSGANGDTTAMVVPGGVSLFFTGEGVRHANGAQLQRIGILPDVRIEPTADDVATGNDAVLQAGLDEALKLAGATPQLRSVAERREVLRERAAFASPPIAATTATTGHDARPLKLAWNVTGAAYTGAVRAGTGYNGTDEITLVRSGTGASPTTFGSFAGWLDLAAYRGKTVRIRGYLSTQNVAGDAGFWFRVDGPSPQFDNMQDRWLTGTSDWKPFAIVLRVPPDASNAYAGLLLVGTGAAQASALTVDIVPDTTPTTDE